MRQAEGMVAGWAGGRFLDPQAVEELRTGDAAAREEAVEGVAAVVAAREAAAVDERQGGVAIEGNSEADGGHQAAQDEGKADEI